MNSCIRPVQALVYAERFPCLGCELPANTTWVSRGYRCPTLKSDFVHICPIYPLETLILKFSHESTDALSPGRMIVVASASSMMAGPSRVAPTGSV